MQSLVQRVIGRSSLCLFSEWQSSQRALIYRKGGPLAVTDANLLLGRLIPDYFPKIFGKSEKEPLDVEASRSAFQGLVQEINANPLNDKELGFDEIVYGLVSPTYLSKQTQAHSHFV